MHHLFSVTADSVCHVILSNHIMALKSHYYNGLIEAGCDEAGRGCLAGSVYAAAVILPDDYDNPLLNDSKQLTLTKRLALREQILHDAVAWAVGICTPEEIDKINILKASHLAMRRAVEQLVVKPEGLIIDGNMYTAGMPEGVREVKCIVKGDAKYQSIAAASILAKTYRDDYMAELSKEYPYYGWEKNAGYPTKAHREGIRLHGISPYHRKSYNLIGTGELTIEFE